ncbi:MAG: Gfo/Idh/MocA family oxidoreductase, partial [Oligoflexia bacterium]|nr:Gfo/Idh/MocA family oxidoreductase [Oligoflexia bacterium]
MIKLAVIGAGHWGPNHVRTFDSLADCQVWAVSDLDEKRRKTIATQYPNVHVTADNREIFKNNDIKAVVVCTPTKTHYSVVKEALLAGKNVLCEKPLTTFAHESEELLNIAEQKGLTLMVGHIFLYNSAINFLKELVSREELGGISHMTAVRTNLGPIRQDVNSVYDLATHDISIFNHILSARPIEVSAVGLPKLNSEIEDVAFITLRYPGDVLANVHVSWLNPRKVRQMTVIGNKKMATWDDLSSTGSVWIYDKGVIKEPYYDSLGEFQLLAREGDISIPKIKVQEPLKAQDQSFINILKGKEKNISDGRMGLDIVYILEATNKSMKEHGVPVKINYGKNSNG